MSPPVAFPEGRTKRPGVLFADSEKGTPAQNIPTLVCALCISFTPPGIEELKNLPRAKTAR